MINFEEEIKKFSPSLEVEDLEDTIYNQDLTDVADIFVKIKGRSLYYALFCNHVKVVGGFGSEIRHLNHCRNLFTGHNGQHIHNICALALP